MATEEGNDAGGGDLVARLAALTDRQHELWSLVRNAKDEASRNKFFDELTRNREEMTFLKEAVGEPTDEAAPESPSRDHLEAPRSKSIGEDLRAKILTPKEGGDAASQPAAAPLPPADPAPESRPTATSPPDSGSPRSSEPEAEESPPPQPHPLQPPQQSPPRPSSREPAVAPPSPPPPPPQPELEPEIPQGEDSPAEDGGEPPPVSDTLEAALRSGGLAPEKTPFPSREADLAAMREKRTAEEMRRRQEQPPVPEAELDTPEPDPEEPEADPSEPVSHGEPAPQAETAAEPQLEEDHEERIIPRRVSASFHDFDQIRLTRERTYPIFAIAVAIVAVAAVAWLLFFRDTGGDVPNLGTPPVDESQAEVETTGPGAQIRAVLDGLGFGAIGVEENSDTIILSGVVSSASDREAVLGATTALADAYTVDDSNLTVGASDSDIQSLVLQAIVDGGYDRLNVSVASGVATLTGVTPQDGDTALRAAVAAVAGVEEVQDLTEQTDRAPALTTELKAVTNSSPVLFASGQVVVNVPLERILEDVAANVQAYPGPQVTIVGHPGAEGGDEQLSLSRAENVRDWLVAHGVAAERLLVDVGENPAPSEAGDGSSTEPSVEFKVGYLIPATASGDLIRVGVVAAGARDGHASTQSLIDGVIVIMLERTGIEVDIRDGLSDIDAAGEAIRSYAEAGYDLIIAHGSEYGPTVAGVAQEFPAIAFALGPGGGASSQPNVSTYGVAADEGAYVLGFVAAQLTESDVLGVVASEQGGDAQPYVDGFTAGAEATKPEVSVPVTFTGSSTDTSLAGEAARAHVDAGADVLTGSDEAATGAIEVAGNSNALWFGSQTNQSDLAPEAVVASQVHRWEVVLRQIIGNVDHGTLGGETFELSLANGGVVIEYNPGFDLAQTIRDAADDVVAAIIAGDVSTGA